MQLPRYEYSRKNIQDRIDHLTSLKAPFGLVVRYAVKANPHKEIIKMMNKSGIHFDASSSYEATELIEQGISGDKISLSSQQTPHNLEELLDKGVLFVATSIRQLQLFLEAKNHPDKVGVRINPDMKGGGHNNRTSTGGVSASFGIWHEYSDEVKRIAEEAGVKIDRMHIHIGSGADPKIWGDVIERSLEIVEMFSDVTTLDIGGGYKVHRYGDEKEADMEGIFEIFSKKLEEFKEKTLRQSSGQAGREIKLEIEPGTYFVAHAGTLVAQVDDIVDTGENGYTFLKINTGMNDFLRTSIYGAKHKIEVINKDPDFNKEGKTKEYVVTGHNCESGDVLTTVTGDPEQIEPRELNEAQIGDEIRIYDTGAYCEAMSTKGYNSFPSAEGVMVE